MVLALMLASNTKDGMLMNTSLTYPSLLRDLYCPCACTMNSISLARAGAIADCLSVTSSLLCSRLAITSPPLLPAIVIIAIAVATVTAIAIGIVVVVIPIGAAATIHAAIRTRCRCCHVWAPIGTVVVDDDAIVADAPRNNKNVSLYNRL